MLTEQEKERGWRGVVRLLPKPDATIEKVPAIGSSGFVFRAPVLVVTEDGQTLEGSTRRQRKRDVLAILAALPAETSPDLDAVLVVGGEIVARQSTFDLRHGRKPLSW